MKTTIQNINSIYEKYTMDEYSFISSDVSFLENISQLNILEVCERVGKYAPSFTYAYGVDLYTIVSSISNQVSYCTDETLNSVKSVINTMKVSAVQVAFGFNNEDETTRIYVEYMNKAFGYNIKSDGSLNSIKVYNSISLKTYSEEALIKENFYVDGGIERDAELELDVFIRERDDGAIYKLYSLQSTT